MKSLDIVRRYLFTAVALTTAHTGAHNAEHEASK